MTLKLRTNSVYFISVSFHYIINQESDHIRRFFNTVEFTFDIECTERKHILLYIHDSTVNLLIVRGSRTYAALGSRDICSFVERWYKFYFGCYIARTIVG